ncbi:MAG: hypothetical protein V3U39_03325 [Acidimicrobiia bacterium]
MTMTTTPPTDTPEVRVVIDTARPGLAGLWPRRPGKTALIALAVLVIAELVARFLAGGLPNPAWNFVQTDLKVEEMEALAAAGRSADVLLIGNSSVAAGFISDELEDLLDVDTVYNAALDGSSMRQMEDWALNVVVPLTNPGTVVIGLTSRDMNDDSISNAEVFDKYFESAGRARFLGEEKLGQKVQRALGDVSALVRISPFLRDPASLISQYDPSGAHDGIFHLPSDDYDIRTLDVTRTRERALNDFALGGIETGALQRLTDALEAQGIEVVIVEMPFVAEDYLPLHQNGSADYEAFHDALVAFVDAHSVPYLDLTDYPWTKSEFYDFLHVNSSGIALINSMLAEQLAELGV